MRDIRYVKYEGTVNGPSDEVVEKLKHDRNSGIDVTKTSVEVISYDEFLSKNIDDRNYYDIFRSMTDNIMGSSTQSSKEMVERMNQICNMIKNQETLDKFDLSFCELLLNPFAFSFYYTTDDSNWPKGVIFCLKDRLDKDAQYVWGNEPFYYWLGAQAVLFDNVNDVRNAIKGMFQKISNEGTYNRFVEIFGMFKYLAGKYIDVKISKSFSTEQNVIFLFNERVFTFSLCIKN